MKDIGAFVLALVRHWVALVASGLLAVALIVLPAWNVPYTQAFNRRHRRVGHLFQVRYVPGLP